MLLFFLRPLLLALMVAPRWAEAQIPAAAAVAGSLIHRASSATVAAALTSITADTLSTFDTELVGFGTRLTLSANTPTPGRGIIAARDFIRDTMRGFSPQLHVELDCYDVAAHDRITSDVEMCNVVGILPGRSSRRIYISGHFDSVARQPSGQFNWSRADTSAPGANDDGSGTVLMMAVAKAITAATGGRSDFFDATLVFMAHVAEEEGLEGAALHAAKAREQGWNIAAIFVSS